MNVTLTTAIKYLASFTIAVVGYWILYWIITWGLYGVVKVTNSETLNHCLVSYFDFEYAKESPLEQKRVQNEMDMSANDLDSEPEKSQNNIESDAITTEMSTGYDNERDLQTYIDRVAVEEAIEYFNASKINEFKKICSAHTSLKKYENDGEAILKTLFSAQYNVALVGALIDAGYLKNRNTRGSKSFISSLNQLSSLRKNIDKIKADAKEEF